jgi:hypothetical protein
VSNVPTATGRSMRSQRAGSQWRMRVRLLLLLLLLQQSHHQLAPKRDYVHLATV